MPSPERTNCLIDGLAAPLLRPVSVLELGDLVRRAAADNHALYPVGGRTMLDFGLPPTRPGVAVDLTKLDQVIDYPARDMTITVQAGITMAKLQETLAEKGQRLPIDVPLPERATLGGAIACNVSGPRRYSYGTLRDYVIGITVVNDEGHETKAGGRVVKNVAGYDLCKLHIGALGTLGIVTQMTLKVLPRRETQAFLTTHCSLDRLKNVLDRLHDSSTRPACIEVASCDKKLDLHVGFEESEEAVAWQVAQIQRELAREVEFDARFGIEAERAFQSLVNQSDPPNAAVAFKANMLPRELPDFLASGFSKVMRLRAHAGNGIVIGQLPADVTLEQARSTISPLRARAVESQGNLILLRCPTEWKKELGVWGDPRGDWQLMREIKEQLDPSNLFNPGRFVDGI